MSKKKNNGNKNIANIAGWQSDKEFEYPEYEEGEVLGSAYGEEEIEDEPDGSSEEFESEVELKDDSSTDGASTDDGKNGTRDGKRGKNQRYKQPERNRSNYTIVFTHTEETFKALAHMQYDLFCRRNYVARTIIALTCISISVLNLEKWWSYPLIAYGAFLATGKYNQANHTARKLAKGLEDAGEAFPSSKYAFEDKKLKVFTMPEHSFLSETLYTEVERLGRDRDYYYIFINKSGGYMIPRTELGDKDEEFGDFLKEKTGQGFYSKRTPPIVRVFRSLKR